MLMSTTNTIVSDLPRDGTKEIEALRHEMAPHRHKTYAML
jgi:hypothetical protein